MTSAHYVYVTACEAKLVLDRPLSYPTTDKMRNRAMAIEQKQKLNSSILVSGITKQILNA